MKHFLELTNGICIEAFPKAEQPEVIANDHIALDTTGTYLQMDNKRLHKERPISEKDQTEIDLFLEYAHRLIERSDDILADSRMFLAPIPIRNGLAYTGTSGFHNATLGIYIEWWCNNKCAWTMDKSGITRPIYYIAGSPLSGCNACAYVDSNGEGQSISVPHFSIVWRTFTQTNTHYTEAKQLYKAYTLAEVIEILFGNSSK